MPNLMQTACSVKTEPLIYFIKIHVLSRLQSHTVARPHELTRMSALHCILLNLVHSDDALSGIYLNHKDIVPDT